jgi:23S rRNA (adenine2503-C2)-methyltransferase
MFPLQHSKTIWDLLLTERDCRKTKALRWKIFRKGLDLEQVAGPLAILNDSHQTNAGQPRACWTIAKRIESEDGKSIKLRLDSVDGLACESVVLFPRPNRATACLSTQVGCAVGCIFCATGRLGLVRNLTVAEILEQLCYARQLSLATGRHLRNVVFMGMGEPLHNFDALTETLEWIVGDDGFGISPRHITVSTIGVPHRMIELAKRFPLVRFALSLHSTSASVRSELIPRCNTDLAILHQTIVELNRLMPTHPVWLEYVLLRDRNDSLEDAQSLIEFCQGIRVEVNVIPYNEIETIGLGDMEQSDMFVPIRASAFEAQEQFVKTLRAAGIFTTLRKSLGQSIAAACGQLAGT